MGGAIMTVSHPLLLQNYGRAYDQYVLRYQTMLRHDTVQIRCKRKGRGAPGTHGKQNKSLMDHWVAHR